MQEIRSGRHTDGEHLLEKKKKKASAKSDHRSRAADITAVVCAMLCAAVLCLFGAREDTASKDAVYQAVGGSTLGAITYTPPQQPEEWSFWDYFADVMAGVFGYTG